MRGCPLAILVLLPLSRHTTGTSSSAAPLEAPGAICLQSSRSIVTATWQQPGQDKLQPSVVGKWLHAANNETGVVVVNKNVTYASAASHLYDLSASWFARVAFKLCEHWPAIVVLFTVGFAVVFPFVHWVFEHRDVERGMFNHNVGEGGVSQGEIDMLKHIRINQHGGLSKVSTLIEVDRPRVRRGFKVLAHVIAISFNVFMLVQQDTTMLWGAVGYYRGDQSELPEMLKKYLEFTGNISLISVRHAVCVALAELIGLSAMVIWIIYRSAVFQLCKNSNDAKFDAFLGLHDAFDGVNLLGGFSALRLVSVAHPALIMRQFWWNMARPFLGSKGTGNQTLQLIYFVITRLVAVGLGVMAFGVKLAFTSVQVHRPMLGANWFTNVLWSWCIVILLLEQTLGAVGLEHVMWWRVMLLVVEGGDRQITLEKIQIAHVYLSRIMQSIYEEYWCKGKYRQFLVLMLTFDHIDLQHLLIDEHGEPKSPIADDSSRDTQ